MLISRLLMDFQPLPLDEVSVDTTPEDDRVLIINYEGTRAKLQASTPMQRDDWVRTLQRTQQRFLSETETG